MRLTARHLGDILERLRSARTGDDLYDALDRATHMMGFDQFAMGHHVDLSLSSRDVVRITSYSRDWIDHIVERGYFADDPIHLASTKTGYGFAWDEVGELIKLTPRHKQVLTEALGFGLVTGFTVPVHIPGEYQGTCSFAARTTDRITEQSRPFAQLFGSFAFEAARRMSKNNGSAGAGGIPDLTPRQVDALVLVGRGKTDREIGEVLGVSRATAHEYVEGVRRAYGNAQRAYMVVRALFDGQVSFADLMRR